eukprot:11034-Heterococcus_DN1.PRE.1
MHSLLTLAALIGVAGTVLPVSTVFRLLLVRTRLVNDENDVFSLCPRVGVSGGSWPAAVAAACNHRVAAVTTAAAAAAVLIEWQHKRLQSQGTATQAVDDAAIVVPACAHRQPSSSAGTTTGQAMAASLVDCTLAMAEPCAEVVQALIVVIVQQYQHYAR